MVGPPCSADAPARRSIELCRAAVCHAAAPTELAGPGFAGESWHNQVHDVVSGVAYGAMLAAPLTLGRGFRSDPRWTALSRPVQALAVASAMSLAIFASRIAEPWNGTVQRAAVTLALAAEFLVSARLLTLPTAGPRAGPGARQ